MNKKCNSPSTVPDSNGTIGKLYDKFCKKTDSKNYVTNVKKKYWLTKRGILEHMKKSAETELIFQTYCIPDIINQFDTVIETSIKVRDLFGDYFKFLKDICYSEVELYEIMENEQFDRSKHSGIMLSAMVGCLKHCYWSRILLYPILERAFNEMKIFISRGIADTNNTLNTLKNATKNVQASLLWIQDLSKDLDPESLNKVKKYKEVQIYVKESKLQMDELRISVTEKIAVTNVSRNLILLKVLNTYIKSLQEYFIKCRSEHQAIVDKFTGLPAYKFDILAPILGPDNGGDIALLEQAVDSSNFKTNSNNSTAEKTELKSDDEKVQRNNERKNRKEDIELIDISLSSSNTDIIKTFDKDQDFNEDLINFKKEEIAIDSLFTLESSNIFNATPSTPSPQLIDFESNINNDPISTSLFLLNNNSKKELPLRDIDQDLEFLDNDFKNKTVTTFEEKNLTPGEDKNFNRLNELSNQLDKMSINLLDSFDSNKQNLKC